MFPRSGSTDVTPGAGFWVFGVLSKTNERWGWSSFGGSFGRRLCFYHGTAFGGLFWVGAMGQIMALKVMSSGIDGVRLGRGLGWRGFRRSMQGCQGRVAMAYRRDGTLESWPLLPGKCRRPSTLAVRLLASLIGSQHGEVLGLRLWPPEA